MCNQTENNLNEKVARKDVLREVYSDMATRLTDKELFILMHLANIRAAYDQVKSVMSITEETAFQLSLDGSDTTNNIAANIHQNPQVVRYLLHECKFDLVKEFARCAKLSGEGKTNVD